MHLLFFFPTLIAKICIYAHTQHGACRGIHPQAISVERVFKLSLKSLSHRAHCLPTPLNDNGSLWGGSAGDLSICRIKCGLKTTVKKTLHKKTRALGTVWLHRRALFEGGSRLLLLLCQTSCAPTRRLRWCNSCAAIWTGVLNAQECSHMKCKSRRGGGTSQKHWSIRAHGRSWLKAEFHHSARSARAQRGWRRWREGGWRGAAWLANKKAAPGPALYNSVSQGLSDATTKFLQLRDLLRIIGCASKRAHPPTHLPTHRHTSFFSAAFSALRFPARRESASGLVFNLLRRGCLHHELRTNVWEEDRVYFDRPAGIYELPSELQGFPYSARVVGDGHGLLQRTDGPRPTRILPEPGVRTAHELLPSPV